MNDAADHLDAALERIDRLDQLCCEPGRSPRMGRLRDLVSSARAQVDGREPVRITAELEAAGALLGELQVSCCTPARTKLYAATLDDLGAALRDAAPMH